MCRGDGEREVTAVALTPQVHQGMYIHQPSLPSTEVCEGHHLMNHTVIELGEGSYDGRKVIESRCEFPEYEI